ncbi:hypothetical protein RHOER0001_5312 [Rhodococcus erythropolis SK121]|nr:hypothetical protein RHOER0001_5312 [Rhodococcus erythropolis SK121]
MQALGWFIPAERRFYFVDEFTLSSHVSGVFFRGRSQG